MLDSLSKMRLLLIVAMIFFANVFAQAKTLDDFINIIKSSPEYDPFIIGAAEASQHPLYPELMALAKKYNTSVMWTPSVAKEVLKLPFHPDRMVVKKTDVFDGWFDDLATPNRIILHDESAFITLLHEIRHAVHLGSHGLSSGIAFDRLLQKNKRRTLRFHKKIAESDLSVAEKARLKNLSTRLVETASEVSAHEGDVVLSRHFGRSDYAESYLEYIDEYKTEFLEAYKILKKHPLSQNEAFLNDMYTGLRDFMLERGLRLDGLRALPVKNVLNESSSGEQISLRQGHLMPVSI